MYNAVSFHQLQHRQEQQEKIDIKYNIFCHIPILNQRE